MEYSPQYHRARLDAIFKIAKENPPDRFKKNSDAGLLRYGTVTGTMQKPVDDLIEKKLSNTSNEPLTFSEITRFNTWFDLHPEKICGQEYVSTSMQFPVMIKGSEQDIITTINTGMENNLESMQQAVTNNDKLLRVRIAEAEAEAMIQIMELEKITN